MNTAKLNNTILRYSLLLFFYLLSLGHLQRIQLTPDIAFYLHDVLLGGMTLYFLQDLLPIHQSFIRKIRQRRGLQLLIGFFVIQTIVYQVIRFDLLSLFYLIRLILYSKLFFLVILARKKVVFSRQELYLILVGLSGLITLFGFAQYVLYPDTRWLLAMGWDDHYYRLISTLFDPGFTGLIIASGLMIFLKIFTDAKVQLRSVLVGGFFMLGVLLTYSRASYLALAIVLLLNLLFSKRRSLYFFILLFFALIPLLPRPTGEGVRLERTASITSRVTSNQVFLQSLSPTEVIWGRGLYRNLPPTDNQLPDHAKTPDNSIIFLFVSLGIIGMGLGLAAFVESKMLFIYEPLRSVMVLIMIHSMINNSLFYIWTLVIIATLLGASYRLRLK
jgi:hypothetical protein